jgi:uncharacterized protein GlcG (DUF336 family)
MTIIGFNILMKKTQNRYSLALRDLFIFKIMVLVLVVVIFGLAFGVSNQSFASCDNLPSWQNLKDSLTQVRKEDNGGLNLDMWASTVGLDGILCAVTFTGKEYTDQWLGSRVISAQKANTANAFSLPGLALSTANLYSAVQPGGSLFGLQDSNPVDTTAAYSGKASNFGTASDPMTGNRVGGINVFGGGLALYDKTGKRVGALGVSGDTSCADHNIAWKLRHALNLDFVPNGVSAAKNDGITYLKSSEKPNGFKHPLCGGKENKIPLTPTQTVPRQGSH